MLTQADIEALIKNRSSATQIEVLDKIVTQYVSTDGESFTDEQRGIADGIFTLLLDHAEADVRANLATGLSASDKLPHELALKMANDIHEVALTMIENSPILKDADLLSFIRLDNDVRKLEAIASRKEVTSPVSTALVETEKPSVATILARNDGADISEASYQRIIELHQANQDVIGSLFQRSRLPAKVIKFVVDHISESMRKSLETKYGNLSEQQELQSLLNSSIERVTLKMLGFESSDKRLMQLLKLMDGSKKLTPFLALGTARMELFEISLARQLYVPVKNIHILLADQNGLRRAYEAAGLPEYMFVIAEITIGIIRALEKESLEKFGDKSLCTPFHLKERLIKHERREIPGMEYMLALLQKNSLEDVYLERHRES